MTPVIRFAILNIARAESRSQLVVWCACLLPAYVCFITEAIGKRGLPKRFWVCTVTLTYCTPSQWLAVSVTVSCWTVGRRWLQIY